MFDFEDGSTAERKVPEPKVYSSHTIYAVLGFLCEYISLVCHSRQKKIGE